MDQENSKSQEKRNWRERLGIGAQGGKELPRISDDFRKEAPAASARPVVTPAKPAPRPATASVKPAPMAPRANPKPINPPPVSPDKLAERLRNQREATTRMADQRVQAAKQRVEPQAAPAAVPPPAAGKPAAKPKFSFAEENAPSSNGAAPQKPVVAAPAPVTPPPAAAPSPQLAPARPPLGAGPQPQQPPVFQPRPNATQYQLPPAQAYPQGAVPPAYPQGYGAGPVPPYRPIDPMTGYPAQPSYPPPPGRGFGVPPQNPGYAPQNGPRLNMPQRPDMSGRSVQGMNPNYPPGQDYGAPPQVGLGPNPRLTRPAMRGPAGPALPQDGYDDDGYNEVPSPRAVRPNSNDYQQAYREAEYGFEDEEPRSKTPWILAGLLLLTLLVATLGVWLYQSTWKPMMNGQSANQEAPAVAAPETPAKVQAEATPNATPTEAPAAATPTKKQIYDRIVGDQEVLGGEVGAPAETPSAIPEPSNAEGNATAPEGTGEEPAPLPIPPPPGGAGEQQGALDPASAKQSSEVISPAAGENQAAVAASGDVANADIEAPPAPGEPELKTRSLDNPEADGEATAEETISDTPPVKAPAKKPQKAKAKTAAAKKLGSKPVVLVPAKKKQVSEAKIKPLIADDQADDTGGGLYGSTDITASVASPDAPAQQPKKRRTLADLFRGNNEPAADNTQVASVEPPPVQPRKAVAPQPAPEAARATGGGFVVQLASFRSRAEATSEFSRLKAKHGGTLSRYSPIITEATVGGSTRYRLSVGSMANQSQASAVCSSLFARGERDCLVKKL